MESPLKAVFRTLTFLKCQPASTLTNRNAARASGVKSSSRRKRASRVPYGTEWRQNGHGTDSKGRAVQRPSRAVASVRHSARPATADATRKSPRAEAAAKKLGGRHYGFHHRRRRGGGYWWSHRVPPLPPGIAAGNGRLEADEIDIQTKFAGRILKLFVDEGDLVQGGQVLAVMDTRDMEAQLNAERPDRPD